MLNRTHSVNVSIDGAYIILKDTTPLSDYTDNSLDVDTVTAINFNIKKYGDDEWLWTHDLIASKSDLRDVNGLKVYSASIGLGDVFTDDLWVSKMTYVIDGDDYDSDNNDFLYPAVTNKVAIALISSDWKDSFNYKSKTTYSKYALKLKSWLDQLSLANEKGLLEEGQTLLNSLKTIL